VVALPIIANVRAVSANLIIRLLEPSLATLDITKLVAAKQRIGSPAKIDKAELLKLK